MGAVRRKDLGTLGTRSLARCEECGRIVDVPYDPRPQIDVRHRLGIGETHRRNDHPARPASLLPLPEMIWGIGKVPRMRRST